MDHFVGKKHQLWEEKIIEKLGLILPYESKSSIFEPLNFTRKNLFRKINPLKLRTLWNLLQWLIKFSFLTVIHSDLKDFGLFLLKERNKKRLYNYKFWKTKLDAIPHYEIYSLQHFWKLKIKIFILKY